MTGIAQETTVDVSSKDASGGEVESNSAMAACLRAQAGSESYGRLASLFGVSPLTARASAFYSRALSELETAVALAALGPQWVVAQRAANTNDGTDADHVVFGPSGAFFVHSRQLPRAKIVTAGRMVMVNGRRVAYVRDALLGAENVTSALAQLGAATTTVRPLVVVGGASGVAHSHLRAPVPVLQLGELVFWLLHQPRIYSAAEVKPLVAIARRLESWNVRPAADSGSVRLTARFERLRVEVDAARARYRLWIVTGSAIALSATAVMSIVAIPAIASFLSS